VDDSPVNRAVLKALLTRLGINDIELAEDGKAALEKLEADPAFDLVLSDMWMPVMDGAELVKRIRADGRLAHLKVCSITADVEARMTYREQGFDMLLLKPVTIEKMTDLLNDLG
jgi:CheY-like chemotaxis protein